MRNETIAPDRWLIPSYQVLSRTDDSAALVMLEVPPGLSVDDIYDGGHIAVSLGRGVEAPTSYFAIFAVDRRRSALTLYVKRSVRGVVSSALLDGSRHLYLAKPSAGISLPERAERPLFIAAGSGLASGVGLVRRWLLQDPSSSPRASFLFVGRSGECRTVHLAMQQLELPVDLQLWDTLKRRRRADAGDLQAVLGAVQPDWIYVCGPADFARLVRDSASSMQASPAVVAECYEAPLEPALP